VKHKEVVIQRKGQQPEAWPCAMVVWATGIKSRPLVERLRGLIGNKIQHNRNAILTDQWLQVKGASGIYALGDCASIEQEKLLVRLEDLFKEADTGSKGGITATEFSAFVRKYSPVYPQLGLYAENVADVFLKHDNNADALLSLDEFKEILKQADGKLRALPATAQVAYQEGRFAADSFNTGPFSKESGDMPFQYKHLGSLAYVGADQAVADFKGTRPVLNFFQLG
jgi:NADH dehydrogenase FAD-containing subunit